MFAFSFGRPKIGFFPLKGSALKAAVILPTDNVDLLITGDCAAIGFAFNTTDISPITVSAGKLIAGDRVAIGLAFNITDAPPIAVSAGRPRTAA